MRVRRDGDRLAFAAPPLLRGGPVDPADLATITRVLHLQAGDVVDAAWVDNGPGWVALLLSDADTVLGLQPNLAALGALGKVGVVGPCPAASDTTFEVRAFVAGSSLGEDPVTGSSTPGSHSG